MAILLELSACDYSKLEAGNKQHWEKYLNKIAQILKIDKYELYFTSKDELMADRNLNTEIISCLEKQKYTYIGIFRKFDDLIKKKDDKIIELTEENKKLKVLLNLKNKQIIKKTNKPPVNSERERESKLKKIFNLY